MTSPKFIVDTVFPLTLVQEAALAEAQVLQLHTLFYHFSLEEYLELSDLQVSLSRKEAVDLLRQKVDDVVYKHPVDSLLHPHNIHYR